MHGPGSGTRGVWSRRLLRSPRRFLTAADRHSRGVPHHFPGWARASKRPFAPPGWPSVSGRPLRDHRSRPASSTPRRTAFTPVRLRTPRLALRSPGAGRIIIRFPLRVTYPALQQFPRTPLPLGTSRSLRIIARRGSLPEARLNGTPDTVHSPSAAPFDAPADHRSSFSKNLIAFFNFVLKSCSSIVGLKRTSLVVMIF